MEQLGIRNMHLAIWEYKGLTFGGFEGSVRYKPSPYAKMYTQEEAKVMLKDFARVDVMVTHCPPFGVNDDPDDIAHTGFHAMRDYLEQKKPRYWFHGHTDPSSSKAESVVGETKVIYTYGHQLIDII
jgi:Icc-related predicted phosphoesterase